MSLLKYTVLGLDGRSELLSCDHWEMIDGQSTCIPSFLHGLLLQCCIACVVPGICWTHNTDANNSLEQYSVEPTMKVIHIQTMPSTSAILHLLLNTRRDMVVSDAHFSLRHDYSYRERGIQKFLSSASIKRNRWLASTVFVESFVNSMNILQEPWKDCKQSQYPIDVKVRTVSGERGRCQCYCDCSSSLLLEYVFVDA